MLIVCLLEKLCCGVCVLLALISKPICSHVSQPAVTTHVQLTLTQILECHLFVARLLLPEKTTIWPKTTYLPASRNIQHAPIPPVLNVLLIPCLTAMHGEPWRGRDLSLKGWDDGMDWNICVQTVYKYNIWYSCVCNKTNKYNIYIETDFANLQSTYSTIYIIIQYLDFYSQNLTTASYPDPTQPASSVFAARVRQNAAPAQTNQQLEELFWSSIN